MSIAVVVPALLTLLVVAPDCIDVFFGDQWDDAVVPLQALCVGGVAHSLSSLHWSVLQARGEAASLLRITLLSAFVMWTAFAVGLQWGIVGVAVLYAVGRWLLVVPIILMMSRAVSFDFWAALRAGTATLPVSLAAAAVAFARRPLLLEIEVPELARVVAVTAIMVICYGAMLMVVAPSLVRDVKQVVRHGFGR